MNMVNHQLNISSGELWVFIETADDGTPLNVGLELLNPGRILATQLGVPLTAVVIAGDAEKASHEAADHGADKVIAISDDAYTRYTAEAYATAMFYLVKKYEPQALIIGATANGRDFAPRLSCRLATGLTADCTQLGIDMESNAIAWTRPAFGGNLMAVITCKEHRPQMGTVRPGVFAKPLPVPREAPIIRESYSLAPHSTSTRVIEVFSEVSEKVDLEGAEIIISGGRGVGSSQGFDVIRNLAEAIGATVGASRAAVDSGWIPHAHQVGQTGKSVKPKLYIACGISGAAQHLAGMSSADVIVAINKDPQAAIFSIANYGIVGDLFAVLPALEAQLRTLLKR